MSLYRSEAFTALSPSLPLSRSLSLSRFKKKQRRQTSKKKNLHSPAHERVVERIRVRRDEAAPPVDAAAHRRDVPLRQGGEELQPVRRVPEGGDVLLGDSRQLHDLPLRRSRALLGGRLRLLARELGGVLLGGGRGRGGVGGRGRSDALLGFLLLPGEHGGAPKVLHLLCEPVRAGLDRHAGAVERLREQHPVPTEPAVRRGELELRQGKGVAQVEEAVHVRVGEGAEELGGPGLACGLR